MRCTAAVLWAVTFWIGTLACGSSSTSGGGGGGGGGGVFEGGFDCDPLPAPTGSVTQIDSSNMGQLNSLLAAANPGDTFSFADGTYSLNGNYLWIAKPGVTLRSASGNREAVVLDGGYTTTEVITIAASNVTIADLTIRRSSTDAIHVVTSVSGDTLDTLIYNVHIADPRQQAIKINSSGGGRYVDRGVVACSHIELTDSGRPQVDSTNGDGCYTGGVDAHEAQDWVVRDNRIEGFWCPQGLAEHAVHFWNRCRGTLVERNQLRNNARGIGFGMNTSGTGRQYSDNPCPGTGYVDHYDGVARNNFIFASRAELFASKAGFDCGICLWSACGARVAHNSVVSTQSPVSSSIEWRFATSRSVEISNNLVTHALLERDEASATTAGNLEDASLDLFTDGASGDLHLASTATAAIDQGVPLTGDVCTADFDGDQRDDHPDIGADELR